MDSAIDEDQMVPKSRPKGLAFAALMAATLVGSVMIIPFSVDLLKQSEMKFPPAIPPAVFWTVIFVLQTVIDLVFSALAIWAGLWLGPRVDLGAPDLEAWFAGKPGIGRRTRESLLVGVALGFVAGIVIVVLSFSSGHFLPHPSRSIVHPVAWKSVLASAAAGVREEIWFRLGLMTLLVWVGTKLTSREQPNALIVWAANLLAVLPFGALHLPQASTLIGLSVPLVAYILALNGVGGVIFGWVYWKRGLLAAMAAHGSADLVLHVIYPLIRGH
jgi:hypothetical protein